MVRSGLLAIAVALTFIAGAAPASAITVTLSNAQVVASSGGDEAFQWHVVVDPTARDMEFTAINQNRQTGPFNFYIDSPLPVDAAGLADDNDSFTIGYDLTYAGQTIHRTVLYTVDAVNNVTDPTRLNLSVWGASGNGQVTFQDGTQFFASHLSHSITTAWGFGTSVVSLTLQTNPPTVPEPTTAALVVASAAVLARRGRRRHAA